MQTQNWLDLNIRFLAVIFLLLALFGNQGWADTISGTDGDIEISPIVHSSVQLEYQVLWSRSTLKAPIDISHAKPADLILVTDSPGHHLDVAAIEALSSRTLPLSLLRMD